MHHNPREMASASSMVTPALSSAIAYAAQLNRYGERAPGGVSLPGALWQQLAQTSPQYTLARRLLGHESKMLPTSRYDAIMQYLIGGLAGRRFDRPRLEQAAQHEQHPERFRTITIPR